LGTTDPAVAMNPPAPITGLYVHVPFCARKCEYCAFYSEASSGELVNRYVDALVRELEFIAPDCRPRTVFFGGGTPSILTLRQWETILHAMQRLDLLGAAEWTVECNPATVSADKARLLRDFGVNRISMGVQSLDENLLDRLGRIHSREQVFKSFDILRQAGFTNLNVDLMFAIPGQTLPMWQATLDEAIALGSEHLSSYEVIYEEDTPLFDQLHAGRFDVNEDLACDMYESLVERAEAAGLRQYEIANFARDTGGERAAFEDSQIPYRASQHNVNYWRGGFFYGLGPSATSYVRGVRTRNWANTQLYCEQLERGQRAVESREELTPLARAGETAAFGLRMVAGWPFAEFERVTGFDLRQEWADDLCDLEARGWGVSHEDRFQLTRSGLRFADAAAELMLRPESRAVRPGCLPGRPAPDPIVRDASESR
jgi:oxygen-independent coproporphyrinogen-3 oxidase